jgi:hypothetical protein
VFKSRKARKRRDRRAVVVNKSSSEAALLSLELEPIGPAFQGSGVLRQKHATKFNAEIPMSTTLPFIPLPTFVHFLTHVTHVKPT